jgi:hypothetical protein
LVFFAGLSQFRQQDVWDIGFSTVVCKNDTAEVFKNTIEEWLTADLTLLHNSRVIIGINDDGCVKCSLQSKNNALCLTNNQVLIEKLGCPWLVILNGCACFWEWKT